MALAEYFFRDEVALSQVLQIFQRDQFTEKLENIHLGITFGDEAANSEDGRDLLDLSVRLLARFYPRMMFVSTPSSKQLTDDLLALAYNINPNIETVGTEAPSVCLAVGSDAPKVDAPTVYAGCNGWKGRFGTQGPYKVYNVGNPFGAGFSACLAAANLFRFLFLSGEDAMFDNDASFPSDVSDYPVIVPTELDSTMVLAGVGAVGNSAAWALSRVPIAGQVYLVDPQLLELSNLQRYALCALADKGDIKVEVVGRQFYGPLEALPYRGEWASFVEDKGYQWERVLVALDSERDRRAVQASLPLWVANAWTQLGDLGVSTHSFLGSGKCLACMYLPDRESKSEDQIVAEGMRIPGLLRQVRTLLDSGQAVGKNLCDAVADAWEVPPEKLEPFWSKPIRELWTVGICGGAVIPLGGAGPSPRELEVPLAFQSALAGVLLAAEAVRDVLISGASRKTLIRRVNVMRPLGNASRRPERKNGKGQCICEDSDFIGVYREKYGL